MSGTKKHDVWIDAACLHVKKGGLIFKIKHGDNVFGTLKVSDTRIWWMPKNKKENNGKTWDEFDKLWQNGGAK